MSSFQICIHPKIMPGHPPIDIDMLSWYIINRRALESGHWYLLCMGIYLAFVGMLTAYVVMIRRLPD